MVADAPERAAERARVVPRASRLLRSADFRHTITQALKTPGEHTTIIALPDDTMGYVFDRLEEAGCRAVLISPHGESFLVALLWPATRARVEVAEEDDSLAAINDQVNVEFFFEYLQQQPGTVVARRVAARLVDQDCPEFV